MTRILLVVWGFERFGGMEQHVLQLAGALKRAGREVTVLSEMPVARSNTYARELRRLGVRLVDAPWLVWVANGLQIALRPSKAGKARLIHGGGLLSGWLRRSLARLDGEAGSSVMHVHGCRLGQSWLIGWAQARGMASVYTEHVTLGEFGDPLTAEGPEQVMGAGVLACVSDHSRASLAAALPRPRAIAVTGHIIAAPDRACSRGASPGAFEILCPARLETHKGIDVLLRALALLAPRRPGVRLTLAGGGSQLGELKALAGELGVQSLVTFAGALSPERMAAVLDRADAVALPSRSEGLPLSLLEAMASGTPVVATRVGGMPEVIESGENGLLVDAEDAAGLAVALGALACDTELRARLGEAGRRSFLASRHHEGRVVSDMLDLYRQAEGAC